MNNLLQAIMTKISGSALSSDVGGRIFLDEAPDGVEFPYVVFFIVSDVPEDAFAKDGEVVTIQFSLFSASQGAAEITDMYADLKALFDDCAMTITSNTLIWCRRVNMTTMMEDALVNSATQLVSHWAVDYELTTVEA